VRLYASPLTLQVIHVEGTASRGTGREANRCEYEPSLQSRTEWALRSRLTSVLRACHLAERRKAIESSFAVPGTFFLNQEGVPCRLHLYMRKSAAKSALLYSRAGRKVMSVLVQAKVTTLLGRIRAGDMDARNRLAELVLPELRQIAGRLMRRERFGHTLQTTALINEAFLRLYQSHFFADAQDRAHFFSAVASAMRHALVEHARSRDAQKRGGDRQREPLDEALEEVEKRGGRMLALNEALEQLTALSPRQAQVVELRFFGGHSVEEVAGMLGLSKRTVEQDFQKARAFLHNCLQEEN
jgi:RNA polymerase sigma-70 factor (ECF subfamily)